MNKIKLKTIKIVDKIRRQTDRFLNNDLFGTQPDIIRQLKIINDLLNQNIYVEVVNTPAFPITENESLAKNNNLEEKSEVLLVKSEVLLVKSWKINKEYDFDIGSDKCVFILAWNKLPMLPGKELHEVIRFASYPKIVYTPNKA